MNNKTTTAQPNEKSGVYIQTFGCQMNEYDTQKLYKVLEADYQQVGTREAADLILVNTCSVRDKPEQKLYSLLGELRELKQSNPSLLIGVGGCVAQQEGENIIRRSRDVDFVFGTHNLSLVPSLVQLRKRGSVPQVAVNYRDEWEDLPLGFSQDCLQKVSAFIAISRGCNKNCTYCIVPRTRGPEVSRQVDEILREVRILARRGVREVVLLGQTVNSYGLDLTPRTRFTDLLKRIAEVEGIERIRFTSPHPQEVRADFFEILGSTPKVCRHIHMPLQSGSDRILKLMNRNYRRQKYLEICAKLVEVEPNLGITTDIIVGFPSESDRDFEETLDVMRQIRFHNSYSFMFSPRPGTKAENMEEQLPNHIKLERLQQLQVLQTELTGERLAEWRNREVEVLVDGPSQFSSSQMQGRTSQHVAFNFTHEDPELCPGKIALCRVTDCAKYSLKGELVRILS